MAYARLLGLSVLDLKSHREHKPRFVATRDIQIFPGVFPLFIDARFPKTIFGLYGEVSGAHRNARSGHNGKLNDEEDMPTTSCHVRGPKGVPR